MKYTYTAKMLPDSPRTATLFAEDGVLTGDHVLLAMYELDKGRYFPLLHTGPFLRLTAQDPASVITWLRYEYPPATCEPAPPLPDLGEHPIPGAIY